MAALTFGMIKCWPVHQYALGMAHQEALHRCCQNLSNLSKFKAGMLNDLRICRWEAHLWVKDLGRQVCTARCPLSKVADKQCEELSVT